MFDFSKPKVITVQSREIELGGHQITGFDYDNALYYELKAIAGVVNRDTETVLT